MKDLSNYIFHKLLIITVLSLSVSSCIKDEFSIEKIDPTTKFSGAIALPVGYFDFRIDNLMLKDYNTEISVNTDSLITLEYLHQDQSEQAVDLFRLFPVYESVNLDNTTGFVIDLSKRVHHVDTFVYLPLSFTEMGDFAGIDSIITDEATLSVLNISSGNEYFRGEIEIPGLQKDGVVFTTIISPESENLSYDLTGYTLAGDSDPGNNLQVNIHLIFSIQNSTIPRNADLLDFDIALDVYSWDRLYGNFVQEIIDLGSHIMYTNLNDIFYSGEFLFKEPELSFSTLNSFSMPLAMSIHPIYAESVSSGQVMFSGEGIPVSPHYYYPDYPESDLESDPVWDSLDLNTRNTNIREVVNSSPYRIRFQSLLIINPDSDTEQRIIRKEDRFVTQTRLHLPFYGKSDGLGLNSVLAFDLTDFTSYDTGDVDQAIFKLYYENKYPADIKLQLYLTDENLYITDSVFVEPGNIPGVDSYQEYILDAPVVSGELQGYFPGDRIKHLEDARYILGEAILTTVGEEDVKVFTNQNLMLNLGIVFDYK